jgi:arylformamidase
MPRFYDVSRELSAEMPVWPGSRGFRTFQTKSITAGDDANVSQIEMDVHAGTHVEGALHFVANGDPIEAIPLDRFVGPVEVVQIDGTDVTVGAVESIELPPGTTRLLFKTRNSTTASPGRGDFEPGYAGLTLEAARWLVDRGVSLVGIDYLSVQRFSDSAETHRVLLRAGVAILEGLDLHEVDPGRYTLICLPLRIAATEAAPARVILVDDGGAWG